MKKSIWMLMVAVFTFSCTSTSNESKTTEEQTAETQTEVIEEVAFNGVLNPNLATNEELSAIGIAEAGVGRLVSGRPYLDPLKFLDLLKEIAEEEQFDDVKAKLFLPMNLNSAAEEDFKMVPKVGDKMAHEFEEYRPYTSIAQFRREIGKYVSEEEVAEYENYVFVPVNLNTASKEEILAIPGVGEKMHHEFEEYRPYESIEQFRREIGKYVDDNELARLERYVTL